MMSDQNGAWVRHLPLVWLLLAVGTVGIALQVEKEKSAALAYARDDQLEKLQQDNRRVSGRLEVYVDQIYRGLRTIARLPGVRGIDRHGVNFGEARIGAQEIYNNLAETVKVSEVYILPVDFDPDTIDLTTGKLQEPIITFDELIVGRTADLGKDAVSASKQTMSKLEEIEIFEYRLMRDQITEFKSAYTFESAVSGLNYPALFGREVITCDNTKLSELNPNDEDRKGLVYSVPFYRRDGQLGGIVSAVVLTSTVREQLPVGTYALENSIHDLSIVNVSSGARGAAIQRPNERFGQYSYVHDLSLRDLTGGWKLRNSVSEREFSRRPDVVASLDRAFLRHIVNLVVFMALAGLLSFLMIRHREAENRNITLERKITERTRDLEFARKDADLANMAKSRFLATMSHEIRTPMSAILGTVEHLSHSELSGSQQRQLGVINQSGQDLLNLINEILDWSAVEAGRVSLSPQPHHIRRLIGDCTKVFESQLRDRKILFSVDVAPEVPVAMWVDRGRFRQVLVNLIANAQKFTERGSVAVHASVTQDDAGVDMLRIDVADTGPGVAAEVLATMFELPRGTIGAVDPRSNGSGLGLVISRELVEMMGGQIGLANRSDEQAGAVFHFQLPLRAAELGVNNLEVEHDGNGQIAADRTAVPASTVSSVPALVERRVLLVEDNPALAALTEGVLRHAGCDVTAVSDGEAAIAAFETAMTCDIRKRFDIVLMDCRLPGMDGITTAGIIRDMHNLDDMPALPIVALTANAFDWDRDACLASGMTDYLSKPFTGPQLIDSVVRALKSHSN